MPAILVDPKGDLTNLLLQFPNLAPADFQAWINLDDARRKGQTEEAYAQATADQWRTGLADWGITPERIRTLQETILEVAKRVTDLPDLLFLFIGGGLVKKQIDELIAREKPTNIRTLPYQPIETLRYSLSAADVHLVAVGEKIVGICHPCKIYGSMAVARPVLSLGPAECHASDILAEGEIGWAIEHGDFDKAERVIREIHATAEADRMAMGREARRMVDRQFSKQLLCGRFADVVEHGPQVDASYRKEGIKSAESAELSHQGS